MTAIRVEDVGWSRRVVNALLNFDFDTTDKVAAASDMELLRTPGLARKGLQEIREKVPRVRPITVEPQQEDTLRRIIREELEPILALLREAADARTPR